MCDTLCFHLFDRTPHAWRKVEQWSKRREEFIKRASFALLACLAVHDKQTPDAVFIRSLAIVEHGATDDRNFVKKAGSWALRTIRRRTPALNAAAIKTSQRLVKSASPSAQWVGKDGLRELTSPLVKRLLARRTRA